MRWNWNAKLLLCGWRSFSDGKSHTLEHCEMGRKYIEFLGSIWTSKLECSVFSHVAVAFSSLRRSELYQNSWKCSLDHGDRGSQCVYWLAFLFAIRQYPLSTFWLKKSTHQNHLSRRHTLCMSTRLFSLLLLDWNKSSRRGMSASRKWKTKEETVRKNSKNVAKFKPRSSLNVNESRCSMVVKFFHPSSIFLCFFSWLWWDIWRGKMRFEASEDFLKIVELLFFSFSKTQQQDSERMHRAETRRGEEKMKYRWCWGKYETMPIFF